MDDAPTNRTGEKWRTPTEGLTISSDASKDLTEDDESLLDRHRRFSRDRHGEMQEMEIALSPSSGFPKASGGIIDEGVAAKYRKMIKTDELQYN